MKRAESVIGTGAADGRGRDERFQARHQERKAFPVDDLSPSVQGHDLARCNTRSHEDSKAQRTHVSPPVFVMLMSTLLSVAGGSVPAKAPVPADGHALLDVPYVSQTAELCGGAAVAMVLRYWGERQVFAQDFASLVTAGGGGILTGTLASAVRGRGWQAVVMPAAHDSARAAMQAEIDRGRPLIALIEVAPSTYHYVVIVGTTDQEVVLHDPARAPFRVLHWAAFDRAWMAAGRWMLLVLPPDGGLADDAAAPATATGSAIDSGPERLPCAALVEHSVEMALAGDTEGAEQGLLAATTFCPDDAGAWTELAGLRFSQSRWQEAETIALAATRLAPHDSYAWQLVATTRYLTGDLTGALAAWNRTDGPRLDTIQIHGAERTPHSIVVRATGLQPRQILTPAALERALRRVRELPIASNARMKYEPIADGPASAGYGLASVDVFIDERKVVPSGLVGLGAIGVRALLLHELRADVAGLVGAGEVHSVAWRWSANRPRLALGLALPSPRWFPGILSIEGSWERQSYSPASASTDDAPRRETRRRAGLRLSDWLTSWLRWQAGGALDHLREYDAASETDVVPRRYFAAESTIDVRLAGDRIGFAVSGGSWMPLSGGNRFTSGALLAAWRSTADPARPFWSVTAEVEAASQKAPLAVWPGAGTGNGRSGLARAHPLLASGIVTGQVFGRRVAQASLEYTRPIAHIQQDGRERRMHRRGWRAELIGVHVENPLANRDACTVHERVPPRGAFEQHYRQ